MQRIRTVLIKLTELAQRNSDRTFIDVDLMLDYTRVLYADLLEIRGSMAGRQVPDVQEPTLDELTAAMEQEQAVPVPEKAPAFSKEKPVEPIVATPPPAPVTKEPVKPQLPKGDIRAFIDLNDKYLFLSEFFGNDLRAYEEAMNHMNKLYSEQEALQYLGHKLDGNDAGIALKNVISRFYTA